MNARRAGGSAAAFKVLPYSAAALEQQFANEWVSPEIIAKKRQVVFLKEYLKKIKARTMVIEHDYIDRDFMEDFSAYYVSCFADYERRCKRLHFFASNFSESQFKELISTSAGSLSAQALQDSYLGFIAVKPLPDTVVGRTCLSTYPANGARHYPIVRTYEANLFGLPLEVKATLAFQEQDRVVAACASSALWSAFHGTSAKFRHWLPSPAEITTTGGEKSSDVGRNLPSKGLTWNMMADAIRHVGLEPLHVQPADDFDLKATVYAYVRGGIPAVLGFYRHNPENGPDAWERQLHAVTVGGYHIPVNSGLAEDGTQFRLFAYRMDRLFVHDDQVGPFARMFIDGKKCAVKENGKRISKPSLGTLYFDQNDREGAVRAIYSVLLLPLYHKIRIPYSLIHETVFQFTAGFLGMLRLSNTDVRRFAELEWDIFITTGNEFKKELAASIAIDPSRKFHYLTRALPRFVWRARGLIRGELSLDLLFDATDIEQGSLFSLVVEYDPYLAEFMPKVLGDKQSESLFGDTSARRIVDWYLATAKRQRRSTQKAMISLPGSRESAGSRSGTSRP